MVSKVQIRHTNPSMGPHEVVRTFSLSNSPEHKAEFENFLDKGTVFGISFRNFVQAHISKDRKVLDKVQQGKDATDTSDLNDGATISHLTIYLNGGDAVELRDLRYYELGGAYTNFISYLVKNGSKSEFSAKQSIEDLDRPNDLPIQDDSFADKSGRIIEKKSGK